MTIEIKTPTFPESISDGTVATWYKEEGESIKRDEPLVDIETDKVVLEVVATHDGVVTKILKVEGDLVESGELLGELKEGVVIEQTKIITPDKVENISEQKVELMISPAARKILNEKGILPENIIATGRDGRITKEDVLNYEAPIRSTPPSINITPSPVVVEEGERINKRVPMTRLRATIARRLVEAQQSTAMLTTYNEVNMKPIMDLRAKYKDQFSSKHGVKLGFMSFFVKASTEALKNHPSVNASIDGTDMVYHAYQDIGVAVSTDKGLVVPVLRNTDSMAVAEIENSIAEYGLKARDGKLSIDDMQGGTFTISNGGIFGSLLSTPILNLPQTAILGMHTIQDRPVAVDGEVVILPMMYLALSYDHRMIDGKEAVQFLVNIKNLLEDPARILLDI
jgi:2-oxoglutarate dehydrogenase E2 component (dihydrolipoamide succinyltransferase)